MKNFYGMDKKQEEARRRRALHSVMGSDLCTTLLKSRIRLQKLLTRMNGWSVRADPQDEDRQGVLAEAMAALLQLQGLPPASSPSASSVAAVDLHLAAQHAAKMAAWRSTLAAQHRRTALLSSGPARKSAQCPAEAVERTLRDRPRLQARTHVSRTGARPPDAKTAAEEEEEEDGAPLDDDEAVILAAERERKKRQRGERVVCAEVFDDSDFYEQLLHDFIRSRSADLEAPCDGRKWSDLQQLRSNLKIVASERASKGRKIRFTVCPKMVNIVAPRTSLVPPELLDARIMDESERDNLHRSLFR